MKPNRQALTGSALTEYGIVLGLIVLTAIGALTMLGQSCFQLLDGTHKSLTSSQVLNLVQLNFNSEANPSASSNSGNSSNGGGLPLNGATADTGNPGLAFSDYHSGGTNATSVEGIQTRRAIARNTLSLVDQLQALADNLTDENTKTWLTWDLIPRLRILAAAEGYAAQIEGLTNSITPGTYSEQQALADIEGSRTNLLYKLENYTYVKEGNEEITVKPSPAVLQTVKSILNQAIDGSKTFAPDTGVVSSELVWNLQIENVYDFATLEQSLQAVQADGTINENAVVANTAEGADKLEEVAR